MKREEGARLTHFTLHSSRFSLTLHAFSQILSQLFGLDWFRLFRQPRQPYRPPQHRLRRRAGPAQLRDAGVSARLAELGPALPSGSGDDGGTPAGRAPAQQARQPDLAAGGGEQVLAPNHQVHPVPQRRPPPPRTGRSSCRCGRAAADRRTARRGPGTTVPSSASVNASSPGSISTRIPTSRPRAEDPGRGSGRSIGSPR